MTLPNKHSQLLEELRRLNDNNLCPEEFLKAVFFEYLSSPCLSILAPMRNVTLDDLAEAADKIKDESFNTSNQISAIDTDSNEKIDLIAEIRDLAKRLSNIESDLQSNKKNQRGRSNSSQRYNNSGKQSINLDKTIC